ncbi:hypothetical protein N7474_010006 [Penicillium riverlandense]|uniref:uncharacterized protein n=1 Tax=Penicillium riverlandense TaxID=1903569 RepID=UPI002547EFF6|nr:uncharacterized protein N7474_010006 [Penicillium riverlandense]KAJ5808737.1 hypothetical protein N7474_010006 [Penicillium riverlandense]
MSFTLKHVDACLPITALKAFTWGDSRFIFQGQGSFFRVIDEKTGDVAAQIQTFRRNNVHGFIPLNHDPHHAQVIVWGGQSLRVVNLYLNSESGTSHASNVSILLATAEFLAPDWIMSGCAAIDNAHDTAYLVTANNAALGLKLVEAEIGKYKAAIHIHQLVTSVKSMLYSADVIILSASHILVTAGTVFGEIIVWSCFLDQGKAIGSIHHFFTGHDGSIFDVRISPQIPSLNDGQSGRLLASCSDDRTVRIWDISDCEHKNALDPSAYSSDGFELRSTGFGANAGEDQVVGSESCVAKAFGHDARIWGVRFHPIREKSQMRLGLVSHGEDSTCIIWDLSWETSSQQKTNYHLRQISSVHHHSGKHIWSLDLCAKDNDTVVYTGGADGALKSFKINEVDRTVKKQSRYEGWRCFDFVAQDCLIACSTSGEIQLGSVSSDTDVGVTWETLCLFEEFRSFVVLSGIPQRGLALISNSRGRIRLYNHSKKSVSDLLEIGERPFGLWPLDNRSFENEKLSFLASFLKDDKAMLFTVTGWNSDHPQIESFEIYLPPPFTVSCASLIFGGRYLILGSKLGGLTVHRVSGASKSPQPLVNDRRGHGREGVSHISTVSSENSTDGSELEYLLTCGRDGNFCLREMEVKENAEMSLRLVHRTSSSLGQNICGGYFDANTHDLMLYGFRSQDFVLRNESKQMDLTSIASGGFRRSWVFQPGTEGIKDALLLWREGTELKKVWIQADINRSLRAGGHGREIKALDVFNPPGGGQLLFATGAEDTTVRIFTPSATSSASPWGSFESLRLLNMHNSGIQQVSWSKDGRYLFTSAASEEFFVWRVRLIPSFGVATMMMAASPKSDPKSDLRITSFDVLDVEGEGVNQGFLICLVLSNSTLKIFHFSPSASTFTLLAKGKYMTNCLTQAHFVLKDSSLSLITAATDGYFTVWDLTAGLELFYTITSSTLAARPSFPSTSPAEITCENRYQIHSNSIKAMELVSLSDTATLIVTGGDDNSLSVSLLSTSLSEPSANALVGTVSVPDAHAASVTAVKVLCQSQQSDQFSSITLASSGNDHRVKIWSVTVDPALRDIRVEYLLDRYSSVADVSSLGLVGRNQLAVTNNNASASDGAQPKLLVCGVGMELYEVDLR